MTPTQVKRVTIKKGDTPRKLFDRESDRSQWKTFAASGFATVDTSSFMTAYTALNPSLNINLPLTPGMVVAVPVIPVSPEFTRMRIKIRPVRLFYEKTVEGLETKTGKLTTIKQYTIDPAAIASLVDDASSNKAQIVNLSLKYYQDMPEIKKAIEERGFALYVVAAGNDDGPLSATNTVYPAMYGGKIHDGLSNIIAVGALDGDLGLAKISNSGPQWVDIGAPGCAIPVLSYDNNKKLWNIQKLHGTSLAAPIVSFAAALIKSELATGPRL